MPIKKLLMPALIGATVSFTTPAHAINVTDLGAYQRMATQLNQLREQFEEVIKIRNGITDTINAVGAAGRIVMPYTNMDKIKASLKRDLKCLIPNTDIVWGVEFEDLDLSLCDLGNRYLESLTFFAPDHAGKTQSEIRTIKQNIRQSRENILVEAVTKGLALADKGQKDVEELSILSDDITLNSSVVSELKSMLAVNNQAQAGILQAFAQQNQILLQMLRIQAATAMTLGVPVSSILPPDS